MQSGISGQPGSFSGAIMGCFGARAGRPYPLDCESQLGKFTCHWEADAVSPHRPGALKNHYKVLFKHLSCCRQIVAAVMDGNVGICKEFSWYSPTLPNPCTIKPCTWLWMLHLELSSSLRKTHFTMVTFSLGVDCHLLHTHVAGTCDTLCCSVEHWHT